MADQPVTVASSHDSVPDPPVAPAAEPTPRPATGTALGVVAVSGVVGTAVVPLGRPGLGWTLYGLAIAAGLGVIAWRGGRAERAKLPDPDRPRRSQQQLVESAFWAATAIALLSVGVVRAAGWLTVLCLGGTLVAGTLAITRARSTMAVALTGVIAPLAVRRGVPWLMAFRLAPRSGWENLARTAAAAAVGVALVGVFGALFVAADPAFADLVDSATPDDLTAGTVLRWCLLTPLFSTAALAGAYLLANPSTMVSRAGPRPPVLRRIEWALPVSLVVALFVAFVAVQLSRLFGGTEYVIRTDDLTFAAHARGGFWQLLAVTLLTLPVMVGAASVASRTTRADRVLLRGLLGALAGCTLVIVASALRRLYVYEQAFGFTRLRLVVGATELWLGVVFGLVLLAGIRLRAAWLPRAVVGSGLIGVLCLAAVNPDQFVAAQNVQRYQRMGEVDIAYLGSLSADAATALESLPDPQRRCALGELLSDLPAEDGWTSYNLGRQRARRLTELLGEDWDVGCWAVARDR